MGTKKAIAVIGEGITEKFYIESLKGKSPFDVRPQELGIKASSLKKLESTIKKAIKDGYDEVYCLIDMDNKSDGIQKDKYIALKRKYHNIEHINHRKGVNCKTIFIESERCTEIWFLYHFIKSAITKEFTSYHQLQVCLNRYLPKYEKTERYFRSISGLFEELVSVKNGGSLECAIRHSKASILSKERDSRQYTYSEMHILIEALGIK